MPRSRKTHIRPSKEAKKKPPLTEVRMIRLTEEEARTLDEEAALADKSVSALGREKIVTGRVTLRQYRTLPPIALHDLYQLSKTVSEIADLMRKNGSSSLAFKADAAHDRILSFVEGLDNELE